jgi:DinB family protein
MNRVCLAILLLALSALAAPAQQAPPTEAQASAQPETNPISNGLRTLLATESKDTIDAVEAMPGDKFGFRPTPQQNSFGHLVVHMIRANYFLCPLVSGSKSTKIPDLKDDDPKDTLVPALKASFDFCTQSLAPMDDSKLGEQVKFLGKSVSRGFMVVTISEDYGDHYSTAAMYLRLNGVLPPTAQPKK